MSTLCNVGPEVAQFPDTFKWTIEKLSVRDSATNQQLNLNGGI